MSRLLRLIPLTAAAGLSYVAWQCLEKAVHPQHFTEEEVRASEAEKGFSHAQELYDHIWSREPFELELDEVTISGEIIRNPVDSRKAVIIAHGHTVNRIASLKYAELFYKAGFHVVIYDQRSFGRSSGKNCTLDQNESQDLAKLIDYAGKSSAKTAASASTANPWARLRRCCHCVTVSQTSSSPTVRFPIQKPCTANGSMRTRYSLPL